MPFVGYLEGIGWDVRTVYQENKADEKVDAFLVAQARELDRIFLGFDRFKGISGAQVAAELTMRDGKVVQISRGPEQPLLRALGKLLFHHPEWEPFLKKNDGIVTLHDVNRAPKLLTPREYSQVISQTNLVHFHEYKQKWQSKQQAPKKRKYRKGSKAQERLI